MRPLTNLELSLLFIILIFALALYNFAINNPYKQIMDNDRILFAQALRSIQTTCYCPNITIQQIDKIASEIEAKTNKTQG